MHLVTFNTGPLINPARPSHHLIGVGAPDLGEKFADLFALSQRTYLTQNANTATSSYTPLRALIAHSHDGLDEVSAAAPTSIWIVEDGRVTTRNQLVAPMDFGLATHPIDDFCGGTVEDRVAVFRAVLRGAPDDERHGVLRVGAVRDFILINAAAALFVVGKCADFAEGVLLARKAIADGDVEKVVDKYCHLTTV